MSQPTRSFAADVIPVLEALDVKSERLAKTAVTNEQAAVDSQRRLLTSCPRDVWDKQLRAVRRCGGTLVHSLAAKGLFFCAPHGMQEGHLPNPRDDPAKTYLLCRGTTKKGEKCKAWSLLVHRHRGIFFCKLHLPPFADLASTPSFDGNSDLCRPCVGPVPTTVGPRAESPVTPAEKKDTEGPVTPVRVKGDQRDDESDEEMRASAMRQQGLSRAVSRGRTSALRDTSPRVRKTEGQIAKPDSPREPRSASKSPAPGRRSSSHRGPGSEGSGPAAGFTVLSALADGAAGLCDSMMDFVAGTAGPVPAGVGPVPTIGAHIARGIGLAALRVTALWMKMQVVTSSANHMRTSSSVRISDENLGVASSLWIATVAATVDQAFANMWLVPNPQGDRLSVEIPVRTHKNRLVFNENYVDSGKDADVAWSEFCALVTPNARSQMGYDPNSVIAAGIFTRFGHGLRVAMPYLADRTEKMYMTRLHLFPSATKKDLTLAEFCIETYNGELLELALRTCADAMDAIRLPLQRDTWSPTKNEAGEKVQREPYALCQIATSDAIHRYSRNTNYYTFCMNLRKFILAYWPGLLADDPQRMTGWDPELHGQKWSVLPATVLSSLPAGARADGLGGRPRLKGEGAPPKPETKEASPPASHDSWGSPRDRGPEPTGGSQQWQPTLNRRPVDERVPVSDSPWVYSGGDADIAFRESTDKSRFGYWYEMHGQGDEKAAINAGAGGKSGKSKGHKGGGAKGKPFRCAPSYAYPVGEYRAAMYVPDPASPDAKKPIRHVVALDINGVLEVGAGPSGKGGKSRLGWRDSSFETVVRIYEQDKDGVLVVIASKGAVNEEGWSKVKAEVKQIEDRYGCPGIIGGIVCCRAHGDKARIMSQLFYSANPDLLTWSIIDDQATNAIWWEKSVTYPSWHPDVNPEGVPYPRWRVRHWEDLPIPSVLWDASSTDADKLVRYKQSEKTVGSLLESADVFFIHVTYPGDEDSRSAEKNSWSENKDALDRIKRSEVFYENPTTDAEVLASVERWGDAIRMKVNPTTVRGRVGNQPEAREWASRNPVEETEARPPDPSVSEASPPATKGKGMKINNFSTVYRETSMMPPPSTKPSPRAKAVPQAKPGSGVPVVQSGAASLSPRQVDLSPRGSKDAAGSEPNVKLSPRWDKVRSMLSPRAAAEIDKMSPRAAKSVLAVATQLAEKTTSSGSKSPKLPRGAAESDVGAASHMQRFLGSIGEAEEPTEFVDGAARLSPRTRGLQFTQERATKRGAGSLMGDREMENAESVTDFDEDAASSVLSALGRGRRQDQDRRRARKKVLQREMNSLNTRDPSYLAEKARIQEAIKAVNAEGVAANNTTYHKEPLGPCHICNDEDPDKAARNRCLICDQPYHRSKACSVEYQSKKWVCLDCGGNPPVVVGRCHICDGVETAMLGAKHRCPQCKRPVHRRAACAFDLVFEDDGKIVTNEDWKCNVCHSPAYSSAAEWVAREGPLIDDSAAVADPDTMAGDAPDQEPGTAAADGGGAEETPAFGRVDLGAEEWEAVEEVTTVTALV